MESSSKLSITNISANDLDAVYELANVSNLAYWTKDDYLQELNRSDSIFLRLSQKTKFAGFLVGRIIAGQEAEFDAELYNIAVDPAYRRLGGAGLLMEHFMSECENNLVGNIWLDVRSNNIPAILMYKDLGFEVISTRKGYYSNPIEDALIMSVQL